MTTRRTIIDGETRFIDRLTGVFPIPPHRRNAIHTADAELVELPPASGGTPPRLLALTTDTVAEEIASGLYTDPYQAGWVAAMASLSDLAAVAADPLGLLLAETIPPGYPERGLQKLQAGIADACATSGTWVLGGDTGIGAALSITTTAVGLVPAGRFLTRRGAKPGDALFSTGRLGRGNGYALAALGGGPDTPFPGGYYPRAKLREGSIVGEVASACMDTSDGVFATLDQLGSLNGVGFEITERWEGTIDDAAITAAGRRGLPPWFLLAGCHGEFELLFCVRPSRLDALRERAQAAGWRPVEVGVVTAEPGVRLTVDGRRVLFDTARLRAEAWRPGAGIGDILGAFIAYDTELKEGE